jgi:DNA-binding IclR family transcriptional regulator
MTDLLRLLAELRAASGPLSVSAVASIVGCGIPEAADLLCDLELRGIVRSRGAGRYELIEMGAAA